MTNLNIHYVKIESLNAAPYNPRKWNEEQAFQLTESIETFGLVDPIIINTNESRKNIVIGGHFRLHVAEQLGYTEIPAVCLDIPEETLEKELNLRLNRNVGDWSIELLAEFDPALLESVGFSSEELDDIFQDAVSGPENFNLQQELKKLNIDNIEVRNGDVYQLGDHRLMCGDSTVEADILALMNGAKADMCLTDPPYILDYKNAQRHGAAVTDSGTMRGRRYLETEELPDDFTEKWMANIAKVSKPDFSIIVFEVWKNLRTIWGEAEKHWSVKNMLVWHIPGRHQNFAAKYKFFSKHDIAIVAGAGNVEYNLEQEEQPLQEEYETALYAIAGKPYWEDYENGKRIIPSDFIESDTDDFKNSGQNIIFGTKPLHVLIPYLKVLTKRGDLVVEPFCGSGSTLIACEKLKRRCYIIEKSPVYAEVAIRRWETLTGLQRTKLDVATS